MSRPAAFARANTAAAILPPVIYGACLFHPWTRPAAQRLLLENQPVEMLTFLFLLLAGFWGLRLAWQTRRSGKAAYVYWFYGIFGGAALLVAGEEVAWGQWFMAFETPEFFIKYNRQRMVTLHNLPGIDARSEIIRVLFGLAGLIGCALGEGSSWSKIAPPRSLVPWFAAIFLLAAIDLVNDLLPIQATFDFVINALSEFVEMMIGIAAVLYLWLNANKLTGAAGNLGGIGKRLFDLALVVPAFVIIGPVLLVLALLVRLKLGKPVLFRQERPGLGGRPFMILKFRTMTNARDAAGGLLQDPERLTPFGNFMRSTSLDELPEVLNVLRGEMSLVGPRPLLMEYLPLYSAEQMQRHDVLPGITGWAQINGRNAMSWPRKFELDVWYVDHQSIWLDLKIIALTFFKVAKREGISQPGRFSSDRFRGEQVDVVAESASV